MVNATFATIFAHLCKYDSKCGIYHVCYRFALEETYVCIIFALCKFSVNPFFRLAFRATSFFCILKSYCFELCIFTGHFVCNASVAAFSSFFFFFLLQTCGPVVVIWASLHKINRKLTLSLNFFLKYSDSQGKCVIYV